MMNISLIAEGVLSVLLLATLVYCILLERRLAALRSGQDGLKQTIALLNDAIVSAGSSMRALKSAAAGAAEALDDRMSRARGIADELSLLVASGDRIAERMDRSTQQPKTSGIMPATLGARLESLKPAMRNMR
jgi:hypothetical protein